MNSESLIGQAIGNYRIISRLGRGGMATVYRARQVTMGRDVAIKIMSADLAQDPQYEARFEREAQVIANLQHPRVLPVHDFGHEGEVFYLVMRVIEGDSLYQSLLHGKLPLDRAARYVNQIAEALDYAHSQGVIHRDLKPNNVLIDELDNLYLMDFGLAKMLAATHNLTQTGTVIGTPQYMAPEQWRGEPVDARTDVYSLGVILYEMVVGRPPFESDTPFTLMYKHVNDLPPSPRDTLPELPGPVEAVILRALAKDPAERFESAGALARTLTSCIRVANLPGAAALVPPPEVPLVDDMPVAAPDHAPDETPDNAASDADGSAVEAPASSVDDAIPAREAPESPGAVDVERESAPDAAVDAGSERGDEAERGDAAARGPALDALPLPDHIAPPPPPIPVAPRASISPGTITGAPDSSHGRLQSPRKGKTLREGRGKHAKPGKTAVRRALSAVDQGLESALEKAAHAAPPLSGPESDPELYVAQGVQYSPQGVPRNAPAQRIIHGLLTPEEELVGVLDLRGTDQWGLWKNALIGGVGMNVLGAILGVGMLHILGWVMWIFLFIQIVRTWRGDIGRYYVGFTSERVILLPRDERSAPQYGKALASGWRYVERLRFTGRYTLLDLPSGSGEAVSFAGLLLAEGEGGLGDQPHWLPHSPIAGLIADQGFEVGNIE